MQEAATQKQITQEEFQSLTQATFIDENIVSQEDLFKDWHTPIDTIDELPFTHIIAEKLKQFSPPLHILQRVTHDSNGTTLPHSPGFGLFAHSPIEQGAIIGEYQGVIEQDTQSNEYLMYNVNSLTYRNEIPHINDGFINVVRILVHNSKGLPDRRLFVAAEKIAPGEQFCWNYGLHKVKLGPYTELRPKETREFLKKENIDDLLQHLERFAIAGDCSNFDFETFVPVEKIRYILETPAVLFTLLYDGTLHESNSKKVLINNYMLNADLKENLPKLKILHAIALESKKIKERFNLLPKMAATYDLYLLTLLAKEGVFIILNLVPIINKFLDNNLSQFEKTVTRSNAHQLQYFLHLSRKGLT